MLVLFLLFSLVFAPTLNLDLFDWIFTAHSSHFSINSISFIAIDVITRELISEKSTNSTITHTQNELSHWTRITTSSFDINLFMQSFVQLLHSYLQHRIFFSCFSSSFISQADVLLRPNEEKKRNDLFLHNRTSREEGAKAYGTRRDMTNLMQAHRERQARTTNYVFSSRWFFFFINIISLRPLMLAVAATVKLSGKVNRWQWGPVSLAASRFFRRRQAILCECFLAYKVKINEWAHIFAWIYLRRGKM